MGKRNILGAIAACSVFVGLSACEAPFDEQSMSLTPVSAQQLIAGYKALHPDADGIPLLNHGNRGFILNDDKTITYDDFESIREILTTTNVTLEEGNRICQEREDLWTGACLELYKKPDGAILVKYEFGNGYGGKYTARGIKL